MAEIIWAHDSCRRALEADGTVKLIDIILANRYHIVARPNADIKSVPFIEISPIGLGIRLEPVVAR